MSTQEIRKAIGEAVQYLSEHLEECRYVDRPATAVIDQGLRCRVEGPDGASIVTDMPAGVGGRATAPSPGWLSRAALAACDATLVAMRAAEEGIELETLEVTVDSESDDRGLLGMDDSVPAGPLSARVRVRIGARGVPAERLRELVESAEMRSPVGDAIRRQVPTTLEVDVVPAVTA